MNGDQPISWLMFFTLAAGVVIVGLAFINFIRSRSNRAIAADTLEGNGSGRGAAADGALPELAGIAAFAFIAMGLLAAGANYASGDRATVQVSGPASQSGTTGQAGTTGQSGTTGMAQPEGIQNEPKRYQPSNPGTDTRVAPTASDTGVGNSPGSTGTVTK
ncbi:hypothetical protein BJ123_109130 [Rhodopseudomonas thermotolerans]|jgi:hypothetical protein|uniref:Uncharacterized protein n=2 Tax=Rhodopseudomonas TaxID=1073 RepID=A0A336JRT7_9BRAD|nr:MULTISPECIES: hypothetical protein [Rhodopseudomonas]RED35286.1 hypothetical protein BJ125_109130 [Rhodopseudomonas pentothenatexigens]REG03129.1 hypothetical protein BJ123_109130 [Rhodopseudomonas thermotolerans]SSW90976.1 hypothetical protein SAMN05892882_109130 [Rhodopseudomonas pentothenatexigens]